MDKDKDKDKLREFRACHRFARISSRKARYVIDLVRGLPVERALDDLRFSQKRATPMIAKVIRSALANATQEAGLEPANLFIAQALVDVGPRMKRFKARAMGRPRPRLRRFCHISVTLREMEAKDKDRAKGARPAAAAGAGEPGAAGPVAAPEPKKTESKKPEPKGAGPKKES